MIECPLISYQLDRQRAIKQIQSETSQLRNYEYNRNYKAKANSLYLKKESHEKLIIYKKNDKKQIKVLFKQYYSFKAETLRQSIYHLDEYNPNSA